VDFVVVVGKLERKKKISISYHRKLWCRALRFELVRVSMRHVRLYDRQFNNRNRYLEMEI